MKQARLEAGISQRQLCGGVITRNMLSQIENGSACPSVETLRYLAERLGKPAGWFLDGGAPRVLEDEALAAGRAAYAREDPAGAVEALKRYRPKGDERDWEWGLLMALAELALARQALEQGRGAYAVTLLESAAAAGAASPYYGPGQELQRLALLARARPDQLAGAEIPEVDEALLLKAAAAAAQGAYPRAMALLEAAEDQERDAWLLLRGEVCFRLGDHRQARACLTRVEERFPARAVPVLEQCCLALEDYKAAYFYACKQKK